ncbi:hypothetical protein M9458_022262, partial [Cirrhinus mrigala]
YGPPFPCCAVHKPEPTIDEEPKLAVTNEPSLYGVTELRIAVEPELQVTRLQCLPRDSKP